MRRGDNRRVSVRDVDRGQEKERRRRSKSERGEFEELI
jgi:hypothetical protein